MNQPVILLIGSPSPRAMRGLEALQAQLPVHIESVSDLYAAAGRVRSGRIDALAVEPSLLSPSTLAGLRLIRRYYPGPIWLLDSERQGVRVEEAKTLGAQPWPVVLAHPAAALEGAQVEGAPLRPAVEPPPPAPALPEVHAPRTPSKATPKATPKPAAAVPPVLPPGQPAGEPIKVPLGEPAPEHPPARRSQPDPMPSSHEPAGIAPVAHQGPAMYDALTSQPILSDDELRALLG